MNLKQILLACGVAAAMCLGTHQIQAQDNNQGGPGGGRGFRGRGNFDPAQMQQRMMERIREDMGVTNDDEWAVIEPRLQKVMEARRDANTGGGFGRMFRGGRRGGDNNNDQGGGRPRGGMFGAPSPELDALQKAIDSNAPAEQIKAALEKYRAAHKQKEEELKQAQADLQKVLTVKQEAVLVTFGMLD